MKTNKLQSKKAWSILCMLSLSIVMGMAQICPYFNLYSGIPINHKKQNSINHSTYGPKSIQIPNEATSYWKSRGYGLIVKIESDTLTLYSSTEISTIEFVKLFLHNNYLHSEGFPPIRYEYRDTVFVLIPENEILFDPIDTFPDVLYSEYTEDPVANFEVFWRTYNENFSLFEITHTDWDSIYTVYRPLIDENTDIETLFTLFTEMLAPLNDGHTGVDNPDEEWYYTSGPNLDEFWLNDWELMLENIQLRMDNEELNVTANGSVLWGTIENGAIGYILIGSMSGYSDYDSYTPDEEVISQVMDELIDEFADCQSVIVDIRLNGGGSGLVSLEIASKFNDQSRISHWMDYRIGDYNEFSEPDTIYTYTSVKNFGNKPVILLTSNYTMSAADLFALAMKEIPSVTLVGNHTYGIFSMFLGVNLPNLWEFTYSMQRIFAPGNISYEQTGIYPDVEIALDSSQFYNGTDNVLEDAIDMLPVTPIEQITFNAASLKALTNPFSEKADIEVNLPANETAELTIVDIMGKVLGSYSLQGTTTIEWNAGGYREGVYFCVLRTTNTTECLKLLLVK